jgi:uncharacterized protein YlzI (FlbEa/FlbD family)
MNTNLTIKSKEVLFISIFDHWLNENEADECKYLNYDIACDNNALEKYMIGENIFINFYRNLESKAILIINDKKIIVDTSSNEFINRLQDGLRERIFLKIYYETYQMEVQCGYDRTDTLILTEDSINRGILDVIEKSPLYILDKMDYLSYMKAQDSLEAVLNLSPDGE